MNKETSYFEDCGGLDTMLASASKNLVAYCLQGVAGDEMSLLLWVVTDRYCAPLDNALSRIVSWIRSRHAASRRWRNWSSVTAAMMMTPRMMSCTGLT